MSFEEAIDEIINDHSHGSTRLLDDVQNLFLNHEINNGELKAALSKLKSIPVTFSIVHHFLNEFQKTVKTPNQVKDFILQYQSKWSDLIDSLWSRINVLENFSKASILTHSHSQVVIELLHKAFESGYDFNVFQTESIPGAEGKIAMQELTSIGLNVELVKDIEIPSIIEKINFSLLGVDQFNEQKFVNKVLSRDITSLSPKTYVLADPRKKVKLLNYDHGIFEEVNRTNVLWVEFIP